MLECVDNDRDELEWIKLVVQKKKCEKGDFLREIKMNRLLWSKNFTSMSMALQHKISVKFILRHKRVALAFISIK